MSTLPHIRITAAGTLGEGRNEIWSCGLKLGVINDATQTLIAPTQDMLDGAATGSLAAWSSFLQFGDNSSRAACLFPQTVKLAYVKASAVAATGKDDPATNSVVKDAPVGAQGSGSNSDVTEGVCYELPYTVSLVMTLTGNDFRRGSAAYGRFYLPCPNLYYSSDPGTVQHMVDGLVNETVAQVYANQCKTFLNTLVNNVVQTAKFPGTTSPRIVNIGSSQDAAGTRFQRVSTVTVDNRPDTVRRRSNAISGLGKKSASL